MQTRRQVACWAVAVLVATAATIAPSSPASAALTTEATRVSVSSAGAQVSGGGVDPAISDDGTIIAFGSISNALAPNDTNTAQDVFVRNVGAGTTTLASVTPGGAAGNGPSRDATISDDGNLVAFTSLANNLGVSDTNGATDIYLRNLSAGTTTRVSISNKYRAANGPSSFAAISGDGTKVVFASDATNLVAGDTNAKRDVFVRDLTAGTTTRISRNGTTQGNGASTRPSISWSPLTPRQRTWCPVTPTPSAMCSRSRSPRPRPAG